MFVGNVLMLCQPRVHTSFQLTITALFRLILYIFYLVIGKLVIVLLYKGVEVGDLILKDVFHLIDLYAQVFHRQVIV